LLGRVGSVLVDHQRHGLGPPPVVGLAQAGDDVRMPVRDVLLLVGVGRDVVQFLVVDESPAL